MLTQEQIDFYRENGYLLAKGIFTKAEAAAFRQEAHDLIARLATTRNLDATWGAARETSAQAKQTQIFHCHNVQFQSALLGSIMFKQAFVDAASEIIGSPNVALHHNKLFIKPPEKGSPFPMHQDVPYFPHEKHSMIAAVVHFDNAPIEKGCIRVVPGSHKLGPIEHQQGGGWHLPFDQYPIESSVPCPAEAGDVLFFSYLTIHGSGINVSDEARTTCLFQLRDPSDLPSVNTHLSRGQGMVLRGIDPTGRYYGLGEGMGM